MIKQQEETTATEEMRKRYRGRCCGGAGRLAGDGGIFIG